MVQGSIQVGDGKLVDHTCTPKDAAVGMGSVCHNVPVPDEDSDASDVTVLDEKCEEACISTLLYNI